MQKYVLIAGAGAFVSDLAGLFQSFYGSHFVIPPSLLTKIADFGGVPPISLIVRRLYQRKTERLDGSLRCRRQPSPLPVYRRLTEAENADHKQFMESRIFEVAGQLLEEKEASPGLLIERMPDAVHHFVGDAEQSDDLTMLAIKRRLC